MISTLIVGSAEEIRLILCGPPQHDEHCHGWRWHLYVRDNVQRMENVRQEFNLMMQERRERIAKHELAREMAERGVL